MLRLSKRGFGLWRSVLALALGLCASLFPAHASLTVLAGEPFGNFGTMMPVGHVAIYLDRVCADGPLRLRMCRPGEPAGVALARYHRIGEIDWVASPIMDFLYAVDRPEDILPYTTPESVWALRQAYRARYLEAIVPDGAEHDKATDEWWETAGVAYNRRVWGYRLDTTPEQDQQFVETMNSRANHHLYHLKKTNCANFGADMVNLYFPGAVRGGDHVADFGLMTPKQVIRSTAAYGEAHPELHLQVIEIPQVPGLLRRSRPIRGSAEAGLKTKRYLFTLIAIQPEIPIGLTILYLDHGRWQAGKGAATVSPDIFARTLDPVTGNTTPTAPPQAASAQSSKD